MMKPGLKQKGTRSKSGFGETMKGMSLSGGPGGLPQELFRFRLRYYTFKALYNLNHNLIFNSKAREVRVRVREKLAGRS